MRRVELVFLIGWILPLGMAFSADPVTIPDIHLKAAIEDQLGSDPNTDDMLSVTSLEVSHRGVETLTGLEHAENLVELDLSSNLIKDLSPLQNLVKLKELLLNDNQITDIDSLSGLKTLEVLNLNDNQVEDITALAHLSSLTQVGLAGNKIHDIQPLIALNRLFVLLLEDNPLEGKAYEMWIPQIKQEHVDIYLTYNESPYVETLGEILFDDADEFNRNVLIDVPDELFVEHIVEEQVMRMYPKQGGTTRTKLRMGGAKQQEVWVQVDYQFFSTDVHMDLYISDMDDFGDSTGSHYIKAGTILPPFKGNPGAVASDRFGLFEIPVDVRSLNSEDGLWLEIDLVQPVSMESYAAPSMVGMTAVAGQAGVDVNEASVKTRCKGICMDFDGDGGVNPEDFLFSVNACGRSTSSEVTGSTDLYELGSPFCIDANGFSQDSFVDTLDLACNDWKTANCPEEPCLNLCARLALTNTHTTAVAGLQVSMKMLNKMHEPAMSMFGPSIVILGKPSVDNYGPNLKRKFLLYSFGLDGTYEQDYPLDGSAKYCNIRVIRRSQNDLYLVNSKEGIIGLNGEPLISPHTKAFNHSRISVGIQEADGQYWGRPILDACIKDGRIYVVPVVVHPDNNPDNDAYLAAAELSPLGNGDFTIIRTFADEALLKVNEKGHELTGLRQSPNLMGLRDIEVDEQNNVYVLNAHNENDSSLLWKFDPNGLIAAKKFLSRDDPNDPDDSEIAHPAGLCYSHGKVYVASGLRALSSPDVVMVYGLDASTLDVIRTVTIGNMYHITGIGAGPDGFILASGFTVEYLETFDGVIPFPCASLAQIPVLEDSVMADIPFPGNYNGLALPLSVIWTGNN